MKIINAMKLETFYAMHESANESPPYDIEVSYVIDGDKMEITPKIDGEMNRNDTL